jgi:hypothetical protein
MEMRLSHITYIIITGILVLALVFAINTSVNSDGLKQDISLGLISTGGNNVTIKLTNGGPDPLNVKADLFYGITSTGTIEHPTNFSAPGIGANYPQLTDSSMVIIYLNFSEPVSQIHYSSADGSAELTL